MASEYIPLNDDDTKELRKKLGLPVTKGISYWHKNEQVWKRSNVIDYKVVETYKPSESSLVLITIESGHQVNILSDYLAEMQKPSFVSERGGTEEGAENISGECGKRIEGDYNTYVVVDLETTGTNHLCDEITEIGAIKYVLGKEEERFNVLVKTEIEIPKKIEKLTGISNDMLSMFGVEPKEAYSRFKEFVGDYIIVGHNFTSFDSKFLDDAYVRELKCHFGNDYIDTLYLAKKNLPELEHHSLESLSDYYNVNYEKAHRALDDCIINHSIYEYLTFGSSINEKADDNRKISIEEKVSDELVEIEGLDGWRHILADKFADLEKELNLLPHTFSIMANMGKDKKVTSYAVCLYEPELVEDARDNSRNTVAARIKEDVLKTNNLIVSVDSKNPGLKKYSESFEEVNGRFSIRVNKESSAMIECIIDCIYYAVKNYTPKASSFACCARYSECSKERKCTHINKLYAKACQYRTNLENGKIYY